ncbi:senescence marker protein-30 (SMP-30) family protein [Labrys miyagiensis]|uniref:Senescence marker protein-30 (SMP-30) family protein n=1 Tax=Labrys miyagiensis TaxID=346912 RepID=A0ABQ6CV41_9HYPH|nr:SMP-30/gluconolactonase/LRE family protein [Labrys miyagiensis]GLS23678.1 senescence marker protein-30 (SMP-30) family protein [Labrys miyagiensis]
MSDITLGEITIAAPIGDGTGEGAVWKADEAAVYWTDITRFLIHRYDTATASVKTWLFREPVVALSLTSDPARFLVALGSRLIHWWPAQDKRLDHGFELPGSPGVRLNDGRSDPAGNFWVGSMRNNVGPDGEALEAGGTEGKLFRVAPDGAVRIFREELMISNTLCWSPDRSHFYFGDTMRNVIWEFGYDLASGDIGEPSVFFEGFDRGYPDGSAMDCEGYLWNCRYGGRCVVRVAPNGKIDRIIDMPVSNITTCAFGGADLKTLYVTSARAPNERLSGSLFSIRTSVAGQEEGVFFLS